MDDKERAKKDIDKLTVIISEFKGLGLGKKYPEPLDWAERYLSDSKHFFEKKDYFTSFGAANYAYGIIDGLLIAEGKKN
ncbi:MAG: DUF357 domain-containing protein [Candidatus Micrarchaeia archaeon]|jgi:hypothetical protein